MRHGGALPENCNMQNDSDSELAMPMPPFEFGSGFGVVFGREVQQLQRDAEAASQDGAEK